MPQKESPRDRGGGSQSRVQELHRKAAGGCAVSRGELMALLCKTAYRYALSLTGCPQVAGDVSQTASINLLAKPLHLIDTPEAFVILLTKQAICRHWEEVEKRRAVSLDSIGDETDGGRNAAASSGAISTDEELEYLRIVFDHTDIPQDDVTLVKGYYLEHKSVAELAEENGIPPHRVYVRKLRGLVAVRKLFEQAGLGD